MVEDSTLTRIPTSAWATPIIPIDKGNERFRICGGYKVTVNKGIVMVHFPFPTLPDLFAKVQGKRWFSKLGICPESNVNDFRATTLLNGSVQSVKIPQKSFSGIFFRARVVASWMLLTDPK